MKAILLVAAVAALSSAAFGQTSNTARTTEGHPDFTGVWHSGSLTPVERMQGATALVATDEEARDLAAASYTKFRSAEHEINVDPEALWADLRTLARVNGQWRTSQVIDPPDGKIPRTEEGRKRRADLLERSKKPADGPEGRGMWERCIAGMGGAPLRTESSYSLRRIVQTQDHLVVLTEQGSDARIIGIDAKHRPAAMPSILGDSTAHWEGDMLVIETVGQRADFRPETRVTERLSLISDDELLYRYTVEDDVLFERPWTGEYSLHRTTLPVFEYACSEGNYGLVNILQAAREAERRGSQSQQKPNAKR